MEWLAQVLLCRALQVPLNFKATPPPSFLLRDLLFDTTRVIFVFFFYLRSSCLYLTPCAELTSVISCATPTPRHTLCRYNPHCHLLATRYSDTNQYSVRLPPRSSTITFTESHFIWGSQCHPSDMCTRNVVSYKKCGHQVSRGNTRCFKENCPGRQDKTMEVEDSGPQCDGAVKIRSARWCPMGCSCTVM